LFGHVEQGLRFLGLGVDDLDLIVCTHAHPDHIEAVQLFDGKPALFALHEEEWSWVRGIGKSLNSAFGIDLNALTPDLLLKEGELALDGLKLEVFHTPGHSPGEICLYWAEPKVLFTGDLVFREGLGRTDLPGGNGQKLKESIGRMADLEIEWLLPGHGDILSGIQDVRRNFDHIEKFWFAYL
jgi:glyoxylase-like metal-dependent hydrolase (beta-lactamase superfamily II)